MIVPHNSSDVNSTNTIHVQNTSTQESYSINYAQGIDSIETHHIHPTFGWYFPNNKIILVTTQLCDAYTPKPHNTADDLSHILEWIVNILEDVSCCQTWYCLGDNIAVGSFIFLHR